MMTMMVLMTKMTQMILNDTYASDNDGDLCDECASVGCMI